MNELTYKFFKSSSDSSNLYKFANENNPLNDINLNTASGNGNGHLIFCQVYGHMKHCSCSVFN